MPIGVPRVASVTEELSSDDYTVVQANDPARPPVIGRPGYQNAISGSPHPIFLAQDLLIPSNTQQAISQLLY
jgi:hypothetical protein